MSSDRRHVYIQARAAASRSHCVDALEKGFQNSKRTWVSLAASFRKVEPLDPGQASSTNSEESWAVATHWIKSCTSKHALCNSLRDSSTWYPSRLLDIGLPDTKTMCLICTGETSVDGHYITLSHCWGMNEFIHLTDSNIDAFKQRVPTSEFPQTFQDTIVVARRLNIRYIWIDSLCIIQQQPSKADWRKESPQMGKVYANAFCNIAATASEDGTKGLFRARNPARAFPAAFNHESTKRMVAITLWDDWEKRVVESPLIRRGWVFQERLLSPRILHFARDEMLWECCELRATERHPDGIPFHFAKNNDKGGLYSILSLAKVSTANHREGTSAQVILHQWIGLLQEYSKTSVTYTDDKLVAIAGLAKMVHAVLDVGYVAGMWNMYLPQQLLWRLRPFNEVLRQPSSYRAPSFSWASVENPVVWNITIPSGSEDSLELIDIETIRITHASPGMFGAVTGGYIDIKGKLISRRDGDESKYYGDYMDHGREFDGQAADFRVPIILYRDYIYNLILEPADLDSTTFRRVGCVVSVFPKGYSVNGYLEELESQKRQIRII
ncbi:heterokaryon incompatibility protein-domain-containing protein [Lophiotrema nucula]|uniref:Heterokaryon incompatibility protein-domain-containing protein n=1 Tax=Lophiotrema nucula TaxID=690887 RepID=A0A6A5ZHX1_9PLEO|nr:heterokaryon incompatibility protein-domain-containing protein [Lophiotrema nucula]